MKSYLTLSEVKADHSAGKITISQLVDTYLERIEKLRHLNAFVEVFTDEVRLRAIEVDARMKAGTAGKLAGMVIGIKDNIAYKGHAMSASSKILNGFISLFNSTVVERLLKEDAIIIGRLNCDEFAMGGSNETSFYGPVKNFDDISKVSGGSSGGSAVAVQADLCLAALGTDTGGSVRQPASFCGVVGLKPTYGRISRYGIVAFGSSFDQVGTLSHSVSDSALILDVLAGQDDKDATSSAHPVGNYKSSTESSAKLRRIAYISEYLESSGLDPFIKAKTLELINQLKQEGHTVEAVHFPYLEYLVPAYYVLTTAEASSNLSRYDGVHFGYRSPNAHDLESTYKKSRSEGFGPEVKRRIMLGTFVLCAGYYDAYYGKAQKVRRLIQEATNQILDKYDFIITPSTPTTAFGIGEKIEDPIVMYLADIFNVQASLAGIPAISVPLFRHPNSMAVGMQLMGKKFDEENLLSFAARLTEMDFQTVDA